MPSEVGRIRYALTLQRIDADGRPTSDEPFPLGVVEVPISIATLPSTHGVLRAPLEPPSSRDPEPYHPVPKPSVETPPGQIPTPRDVPRRARG